MSAMAEPGTAQHAPRQHVVVVGADTSTVRLAEELVYGIDRECQLGGAGRSLGQLEESGASRILAWSRSSGTSWQWGHLDHELAGNERIAVVATRAGLAPLLRVTRVSATANQA
jgi:hypothetical protein